MASALLGWRPLKEFVVALRVFFHNRAVIPRMIDMIRRFPLSHFEHPGGKPQKGKSIRESAIKT
jgi:hypothetical protein